MSKDDRSYFQQRAKAELARAQQAVQPSAVRAHHQLAEANLERVAALDVNRKGDA